MAPPPEMSFLTVFQRKLNVELPYLSASRGTLSKELRAGTQIGSTPVSTVALFTRPQNGAAQVCTYDEAWRSEMRGAPAVRRPPFGVKRKEVPTCAEDPRTLETCE